MPYKYSSVNPLSAFFNTLELLGLCWHRLIIVHSSLTNSRATAPSPSCKAFWSPTASGTSLAYECSGLASNFVESKYTEPLDSYLETARNKQLQPEATVCVTWSMDSSSLILTHNRWRWSCWQSPQSQAHTHWLEWARLEEEPGGRADQTQENILMRREPTVQCHLLHPPITLGHF